MLINLFLFYRILGAGRLTELKAVKRNKVIVMVSPEVAILIGVIVFLIFVYLGFKSSRNGS